MSRSSTPSQLVKRAETKKIRAKSPEARPGPAPNAHMPKDAIRIPSVPYWIPKAWSNNDQLIAKLFEFRTMGEYNDRIRGKGDNAKNGEQFFVVHWQFVQFAIAMASKAMVSVNQFVELLKEYSANRKTWDLISKAPEALVAEEQVRALGDPRYINEKDLDRAVVGINRVKQAHWVMMHLDDHLNRPGPIANHSLYDWVLAYMLGNRLRTNCTKESDSTKYHRMKSHNRDKAPQFHLVPLEEGSGSEQQQATAEDAEDEEDALAHVHVQIDDTDQIVASFTKEKIEKQLAVVEQFNREMAELEGKPIVDSKGRNIRIREPFTSKTRTETIDLCMRELEVLADGSHPRLTTEPLEVGSRVVFPAFCTGSNWMIIQMKPFAPGLDDHPNGSSYADLGGHLLTSLKLARHRCHGPPRQSGGAARE
jgi:hypothetical protein